MLNQLLKYFPAIIVFSLRKINVRVARCFSLLKKATDIGISSKWEELQKIGNFPETVFFPMELMFITPSVENVQKWVSICMDVEQYSFIAQENIIDLLLMHILFSRIPTQPLFSSMHHKVPCYIRCLFLIPDHPPSLIICSSLLTWYWSCNTSIFKYSSKSRKKCYYFKNSNS